MSMEVEIINPITEILPFFLLFRFDNIGSANVLIIIRRKKEKKQQLQMQY